MITKKSFCGALYLWVLIAIAFYAFFQQRQTLRKARIGKSSVALSIGEGAVYTLPTNTCV